MSFLKTTALFALVKGLLTALETESEEPLFERIEFYDSQKMAEALRALTIFKTRVGILVPAGDTYSNALNGQVLTSSRTTQFHLLIGDRDYSTKPGAFFGTDKNVGVLDMKDIVVEALTGAKVGPGMVLAPIGGGALTLPDKQAKDSPGRETWVQSFEVLTGRMRVATSAGTGGLT